MTAQGIALSILSMLSSAKHKKIPPDNAIRKQTSRFYGEIIDLLTYVYLIPYFIVVQMQKIVQDSSKWIGCIMMINVEELVHMFDVVLYLWVFTT